MIDFYKYKYLRKSDFQWSKEFRKEEYYERNIRALILGRRFSRFSFIKSRVFDRNMIDGLCYGKFYGRQKIIFERKELANKRKLLRAIYV